MCQSNEETEVTLEHGVVRSKVFNFLSIGSASIVKIKTENVQKVNMCEYKLGTGIDGSLMPILMVKVLFLLKEWQ